MTLNSLLEFLDQRAGEYHRGTVRYSPNDIEIVYLRDDVEATRLNTEIREMLGRLRPESSQEEVEAFPFEKLQATLRRFDDAIILHFPVGDERGVVVSLEPQTARDLNTFIGECEERIRR